MLRFLVGICGIGFGHSLRQSLVIEKLVQRGARVAVFCFGKSLEYMQQHSWRGIPFAEVSVPWVYAGENGIEWERTERANIHEISRRSQLSQRAFRSVPEMLGGEAHLCISDYEPETAAYAYHHGIPLITVDQQSKFLGYQTEPLAGFHRNEERARISYFFPYAEARHSVSFYQLDAPPDPEFKVQIHPSPVRNDVLTVAQKSSQPAKKRQVVVYFSPYGPTLQPMLEIARLLATFKEWQFIIYNNFGPETRTPGIANGNLRFKQFDPQGFATDLRAAEAMISTAGHTLLSEAIFLGIPAFTIPLSTYDQHYCGRIIARQNAGQSNTILTAQALETFFSHLPAYREGLQANSQFTVSSEISAEMIEECWQIAQAQARRRSGRLPTRSKAHRAPSFIPDRLYLPDLASFLRPPAPGTPDYRTAVIKPTMSCVCRCSACEARSKGWWHTGARALSLEQWDTILRQAEGCGLQVVQISGGEPTLYPQLPELVRLIRDHHMAALLNTNGYFTKQSKLDLLVAAGLNGINFSLDSPKPQIHDELRRRPGIWGRCVDALRAVQVHRDKTWSAIRMVLTASTLLDLPEMIRLAITLGVGSLKLSYLEWGHPDSPLLPSLETLRHFKQYALPACLEVVASSPLPAAQKEISSFVLENLLYPEQTNALENYACGIYWAKPEDAQHCQIPNSLVIIYGDGNVLPCNAAEYARQALPGNLHQDSLEELLYSPAMEVFRQVRPPFCRYCPMPLHVTLPLWETCA